MAMADAERDLPADDDDERDSRTRLMEEVAEQMDAIEADYPDGFKIGRVITLAEIIEPDGSVGVRIRAGQWPWVTLGMLDWAKKDVEDAARRPTGPQDEG
jgi:hypothetical protein